MEPIGGRSFMGSNTNTTMVTTTSATSAVVGHLMTPTRSAVDAVARNTKTGGLGHNDNHRMPSKHYNNDSNVLQHHQYHSPILVSPSPQLMLSTTTATASGVIPQFQQHNSRSHQLITSGPVPMSSTTPTSHITTGGGMALSPFGILPHERVVPQHINHRNQHRKLSTCSQSSKPIIDTSGTQVLTAPAINSQRFYVEPTHFNKMKQYDSVQHQPQQNQRFKDNNLDKGLPLVPSVYAPQSYDQRYQSRTASQQVGYLSVITRTAVTTSNSCMMDDIPANNNYYPPQTIPIQSKISADNHERQYYHFDNTASASQTPQHQLDNILLMGNPVQRGDPMHIVKNLQSMQTDIDCYGVKMTTDHNKILDSTLLNNDNKCMVDQHQLTKSSVISSSSYNGQYFNRRQPPPAHLHNNNQTHLQQYMVNGNTKMLPTPTSLTVISANGNTYFDVHQHQRHRWNLDQRKPMISTPSCFQGNISTGISHQTSLNHDEQFNNVVSTFSIPSTVSNIFHYQQNSSHYNNPTYFNPTSTIMSPIATSVTNSNHSLSLYNRQCQNAQTQHQNGFNDSTNNLQNLNYVASDNKSCSSVIVPNIEEELKHLCDDSLTVTSSTVKPLNVKSQQPSFIDSYIKFIHGANNSNLKMSELNEKPKKILRPQLTSTSNPMSKKYTSIPKSKVVQSSSHNGSSEKVVNNNPIHSSDIDDPRYFQLPKTSSSIAEISDCSNNESNWLSADDEQDNWWTFPSKTAINYTSVIKNKTDVKKKNDTTKKNSNFNKRQKKQHFQPRRQLSHRLAKEKSQELLSKAIANSDDNDSISDPDSDIDPAWKPNNDEKDSTKNSNLVLSGRHFNHKKYSKELYLKNCDQSTSLKSSINNNNVNDTQDESTVIPFKSGTFLALKNQLPNELWRVDGKSLLQKFERCIGEDNIFKSVSSYNGWNPKHFDVFREVSVKLVTKYKNMPNKSDVVVELCEDALIQSPQNNSAFNSNSNYVSKPKDDVLNSINNEKSLRANFVVYVQSLTSQVLDSNFLEEIYRENDEFFLSNINTIESVTQKWIKAMDSTVLNNFKTNLSRIEDFRTILKIYPIFQMHPLDAYSINLYQPSCVLCDSQDTSKQKFLQICLSGTEYNSLTLKDIEDDKSFFKILSAKKFFCCSNTQCTDTLHIWHSIAHLKYKVYKECWSRIITENGLNQDTTSVLNRLLADEKWVEKLFQIVSATWCHVENFISSNLTKL